MPPNSGGAPLQTSMRRAPAAAPTSPHLLSVQRSEFEDFMNAYRPTLDHPPPTHQPRPAPEEAARSDFGRSIKKLMRGSPATQSKNPSARTDPKAPEKQKSKRPAEGAQPGPPDANFVRVTVAPPPVPPPPKKTSTQQPPPKSPTKKTSKASSSPLVKPRQEAPPPPEVRVEKRRSAVDPDAQQHCLVVTNVGRFLPARHNPDPILSLRVVPVPERKYHVILEFEEAPPPARQLTSSSGLMVAPLEEEEDTRSREIRNQLAFFHWLRESHVAPMGMLLMNVEKTSEFPFVTYLVVGGGRSELAQKLKFVGERPVPDRHDQLRFLAGYEEPVTVCHPPATSSPLPDRPPDRAGFVVCLYQVLAGEDQPRFEQNWAMWTGARQIYRTLPPHMGLRRISVHKSLLPSHAVHYVLVCEFAHIMEHLTDACVIIDTLRARCCGFIGIYRVLDTL